MIGIIILVFFILLFHLQNCVCFKNKIRNNLLREKMNYKYVLYLFVKSITNLMIIGSIIRFISLSLIVEYYYFLALIILVVLWPFINDLIDELFGNVKSKNKISEKSRAYTVSVVSASNYDRITHFNSRLNPNQLNQSTSTGPPPTYEMATIKPPPYWMTVKLPYEEFVANQNSHGIVDPKLLKF